MIATESKLHLGRQYTLSQTDDPSEDHVDRAERLGGLLKYYHREPLAKAA